MTWITVQDPVFDRDVVHVSEKTEPRWALREDVKVYQFGCRTRALLLYVRWAEADPWIERWATCDPESGLWWVDDPGYRESRTEELNQLRDQILAGPEAFLLLQEL